MIFRSSVYLMKCTSCMHADVSLTFPAPSKWFYSICHKLRLRVECHKRHNPFYFLYSLCAEHKQASLMSSVHHQPCLTGIISSGLFLKDSLN